ncbi:MAG: OmpH family outer membrane protein [Alistipes sp.]|nr:OmpH family outer membrane protein [Alistipes sp.]
MKRLIIAVAAVILAVGAASAQKYMVVDSEKIFRSLSDYNNAMTTLDNLAKDYQTKVDAAYAEIEKLYNSYVAEKQSLSATAQQSREQLILAKEKSASEYQQAVFGNEGVMMKKRIELIQPIQNRVFKAIEKYAQSGGYDMVLDTASNPSMLYYNAAVDHTQKIIELLNK